MEKSISGEPVSRSLLTRYGQQQRAQSLLGLMSQDTLLRDQFVTDPSQLLAEYLDGRKLAPEQCDASNQLLFAMASNAHLQHWIRSTALRSTKLLAAHSLAIELAQAVAHAADPLVNLALIRLTTVPEGHGRFLDQLGGLIDAIGSGRLGTGTEMSPGHGTEHSPGGTEMSPGHGTEHSPGGTEMSPGHGTEHGTEHSPGGTEMSPGALFGGTEMSPGHGTEHSPGGTEMSPGHGTEHSPGGTEMSPGHGTEHSPGGTEMSPGHGTEHSPGGTEMSPGHGLGFRGDLRITMAAFFAYATRLRAAGALNVSGFEYR